jgi:transcriptional regulator with XRE-family HTH domain
MVKVGEKIRKVRELRGFSQQYMADNLSISQKAYSKLESNETKLTLDHVSKISTLLEVDPIQLLSFDENLIFNNCSQGNFGNHNTYYAYSEHEKALYESRIKHLED